MRGIISQRPISLNGAGDDTARADIPFRGSLREYLRNTFGATELQNTTNSEAGGYAQVSPRIWQKYLDCSFNFHIFLKSYRISF
jgi:hypothetical protein